MNIKEKCPVLDRLEKNGNREVPLPLTDIEVGNLMEVVIKETRYTRCIPTRVLKITRTDDRTRNAQK